MNHERLTEALYDWLVASSPVAGVPLGMRLLHWREVNDPELAERWRSAVDDFLAGIGATQVRGEEVTFDVYQRPATAEPEESDDGGEEHRITPDGG